MRYQPQGSARLNTNPLRRGLVSYMLLTGKSYADVADGSAWTPVGPVGFDGAPRGLGMHIKGAALAYVARALPAAITSGASQPLTFRFRVYFHTVPTSSTNSIMSWGNTAQDPSPRFLVRATAGALSVYFTGSYHPTFTVQAEKEYILTFTSDGSFQIWYLNGVQMGSASFSPFNGNASNLFFGIGYNGPDASTDYVLSDFAAWNRGLSPTEVRVDADNPWLAIDSGSSSSAYQSAIASVGASGAAVPPGSSYTASLSDALTPGDIQSNTFFTPAQVADILSTATQASAAAALGASLAETLVVSDTAAAVAALSAAGVETIIISDVSSTSGSGAASITESVSIAEALGVLSAASAALSDTISATDASSTNGSGSAGISDSLNIADSRTAQVSALAALLDSLGVADQTYVAGSASAAAGSDTLTIGELRSGQLATASGTADSLSPTEALAASLLSKTDVTISANLIPRSRWVTFDGGTRVVVFAGGTRVVIFESLGGITAHTVQFDGGIHTVKFDGGMHTVIF